MPRNPDNTAQQTQAQAQATMGTDLVTLYQALGGGWEEILPDEKERLSGPLS